MGLQTRSKAKDFTTMRFAAALLLVALGSAAAFDVPSLTPSNYDEMTDGKTVFIKFFAPWVSNGHQLAVS